MSACEIEQFTDDPRLRLPLDSLTEFHATSIERIQRVEGKAMGTLVGVGVAVTVVGGVSGILGQNGVLGESAMAVRVAAAVLLLLAMVYFLASGGLSLHGYRTGTVYRPDMTDCEPIAEPRHLAKVLIYCIEQNYRVASMRVNSLTAAINCLRNGLVAVGLLSALVAFAALATAPDHQSCCGAFLAK